MTKGENVQLSAIGNQLAALVQEMKDHKEAHEELKEFHDEVRAEIFGSESHPGLRTRADVIEARVRHIWWLYGILFIAIAGAVIDGIFGG